MFNEIEKIEIAVRSAIVNVRVLELSVLPILHIDDENMVFLSRPHPTDADERVSHVIILYV